MTVKVKTPIWNSAVSLPRLFTRSNTIVNGLAKVLSGLDQTLL